MAEQSGRHPAQHGRFDPYWLSKVEWPALLSLGCMAGSTSRSRYGSWTLMDQEVIFLGLLVLCGAMLPVIIAFGARALLRVLGVPVTAPLVSDSVVAAERYPQFRAANTQEQAPQHRLRA